MKKIVAAALVLSTALGATAAHADTIFDRDEGTIITGIEAQGFVVEGVEEWGTSVRAFIVDTNGRRTMALFDPSSLKRIGN